MTITQDEAVQMAKECGQNWQFYNYRQTTMVTTIEELTAFANLAYQRGLSEANAKAERGELVEIHRVVMCIGRVKEAPESDTYTLRAVKQMAMRINESDEKLREADSKVKEQEERISELERILGGLDHACQLNHSIISEQDAKIAELEARLEGEAAAYLQIGIGPNEGMVLLAKRIPKNYDKTWWKFEPLFTNPSADAKDAELINWLETEMYDLRCISVPTGGDDYCEHWEVISHHMAKPNERTEGYGKTPREAIRAAIAAERK